MRISQNMRSANSPSKTFQTSPSHSSELVNPHVVAGHEQEEKRIHIILTMSNFAKKIIHIFAPTHEESQSSSTVVVPSKHPPGHLEIGRKEESKNKMLTPQTGTVSGAIF